VLNLFTNLTTRLSSSETIEMKLNVILVSEGSKY
jgi:hypothetical protein